MDLEQLAAAAMKRLIEQVNRSAGQHQRAVRAGFLALHINRRNSHVTNR